MVTRNDLDLIFDPLSFVETQETFAPSVVTGYGTVEGRLVYMFLQNREEEGGAFSKDAGRKIQNLYRLALKTKAPVIGLLDSSGFRIDEGAEALNAFSELYSTVVEADKDILQIMIVGGQCLGQMASLAEIADFCFRDMEVEEAFEYTREIIMTMPHSRGQLPEQFETEDDLNRLIPGIETLKGRAEDLLSGISDDGFWMEMKGQGSPELKVGFIKLNGLLVAALAGNREEGVTRIGYKALLKAARLVRIASKFNLSLVKFSDTDGLSTEDDKDLMTQASATLVRELAAASIPKIEVITGSVTGGAFSIMSGRGLGSDLIFMWEGAEVNAINPRQAAELLRPDMAPGDIEKETAEYVRTHSDADCLESKGIADRVILPEETRKYIIGALETYANVY